jgi:hypothetical protein
VLIELELKEITILLVYSYQIIFTLVVEMASKGMRDVVVKVMDIM